jgi:hypothetical protein
LTGVSGHRFIFWPVLGVRDCLANGVSGGFHQ